MDRSLWGTDRAKPDYAYPYDPRDAGREYLDAPRQVYRILRGGSWDRNHRVSRCAVRDYYAPNKARPHRFSALPPRCTLILIAEALVFWKVRKRACNLFQGALQVFNPMNVAHLLL